MTFACFIILAIAPSVVALFGKTRQQSSSSSSSSYQYNLKSPCPYGVEVVNEQYRYMLGRNATPSEVDQYASFVFSGTQLAYYEPYMNMSSPSVTYCTKWAGRCTFPMSIPDTNAEEFAARGGDDSPYFTALLRSLWCVMPTIAETNFWTQRYLNLTGGNDDNYNLDTTAMQTVAREIKMSAPPSAANKICPGSINDVYERLYGRSLELTGCNVWTPENNCPPKGLVNYPSIDCCYYSMFLNGTFNSNDIIHYSRSNYEYVYYNEATYCYNEYPIATPNMLPGPYFMQNPQFDPHAIGEYATQIYRIVFNERPSAAWLNATVNRYHGNNTQPLLYNISLELLSQVRCDLNTSSSDSYTLSTAAIVLISIGCIASAFIVISIAYTNGAFVSKPKMSSKQGMELI